MNRQYDLFEVLQDGSKMWKTSASGREAALKKIVELEANSANRIVAIHLETRETITPSGERDSKSVGK